MLASAGAAQVAEAPRAVDVRFEGASSPSLVSAIAQVGKTVTITLAPNDTIRGIIETRCGIVNPAYVVAFLKENQLEETGADLLERPQPGTHFDFPYCIKAPTTLLRVGETRGNKTISGIYSRNGVPLDARALQEAFASALPPRSLGTTRLFAPGSIAGSNRGFVATEFARKFVRENPAVDPSKLQPGDVISAPPRQHTETIPLRKDLTIDAAKSIISQAAPVAVNQAQVAELIDDYQLAPGECDGADSADWPIPAASLRMALANMIRLAPRQQEQQPPTILLIDTGYDPAMGPPAILPSDLGALRQPDPEALPEFPGLNATDPLSRDADPPEQLKSRAHGGEVAAVLLGRRFAPTDDTELKLPKITFASIATTDGAGVPYLDAGAISTAYLIARRDRIPIINASIAALARRQEFLDLISKDSGVLLVAAAGNVSTPRQDFSTNDSFWPGSMGGDPGNAGTAVVLSVGAHDPKGRLMGFSRDGPQVDLLAPGCRIRTYTQTAAGVVQVERSGTSYAAPIVSFVASQLARVGLSPSQIKDRLIISADVDERVANMTWSGGRLNVLKALSLWRDQIAYVEHVAGAADRIKVISGLLRSPHAQIELCDGSKVEQRFLRKLVYSVDPGNPAVPARWRGWVRKQNPAPSTAIDKLQSCRVDEAKLGGPEMVIETDDRQTIQIPVNDIREFVARIPD